MAILLSVTTVKKKNGRPQLPFKTPDGKTIDGLRQRKSDGRWVIIETGKMFVEADWRLAVQRFRRWEAMKLGVNAHIALPKLPLGEVIAGGSYDDVDAAVKAALMQELGSGEHLLPMDPTLIVRLTEADPIAVIRAVPIDALAIYFREELITNRRLWAERTGIEELAYLSDLKPKVPLPSPAELQSVWEEHATCSREQVRKVSAAWEDFSKTTEIETLDHVTPELCVAFRDDLHARDLSGKQQQHISTGIRRIITFAINRALHVKALSDVLVSLKLISPDDVAVNADPKPIELEEWRAIYRASAAKPEDRAMVLLMLNAALYCKEAAFLEWSDFTKDGTCLLSNRRKTGQCIRAAKLWSETRDALKVLPRKGERLFYNYAGAPIAISGAQLRFSKLAERAGVKVTASQFRDGAATAAAVANCNEQLVKLMLGHSCGMGDLYIKRNPAMVSPATDAVYSYYFT